MLKKLKLKRTLKLINKEISQTKGQPLNSTFTIHYKNNILSELFESRNKLQQEIINL